ncbi:unnamed protein product [Rodentolepis nana]|uniref:Uncharacterized protein n=1 Tax=Rodentolepis nana TaxID=102285 RepID=A0A3P7T1K5_RODNA|nr:unnamed protein product [Rodentolepis nana]
MAITQSALQDSQEPSASGRPRFSPCNNQTSSPRYLSHVPILLQGAHCIDQIYTNPHSLDCGHVFCLSPCILSFQTDGASIHCSSCGFASPIDDIKVEEKIGKEVRDFKLKNEYVEISSCPNCQRLNCNVCELCKHCDRYLCHECATSHQTMYSSVLFSRLLDLQLRYKNYVDRRGEMKWENANDAIERLQETIEGALLRAEICLESLEILFNDQSPETSTKLTKITELFTLSERNGGLSKRLSNTASEIRNGYSRTSYNLPLNVQNFVNKYQKDFKVSKKEVASSSESSLTSSLSRNITPTPSFNLSGPYVPSPFESDESIPAIELPSNEIPTQDQGDIGYGVGHMFIFVKWAEGGSDLFILMQMTLVDAFECLVLPYGMKLASANFPPSSGQPVSIGAWVRRRLAITQSALQDSQEPSASGYDPLALISLNAYL